MYVRIISLLLCVGLGHIGAFPASEKVSKAVVILNGTVLGSSINERLTLNEKHSNQTEPRIESVESETDNEGSYIYEPHESASTEETVQSTVNTFNNDTEESVTELIKSENENSTGDSEGSATLKHYGTIPPSTEKSIRGTEDTFYNVTEEFATEPVNSENGEDSIENSTPPALYNIYESGVYINDQDLVPEDERFNEDLPIAILSLIPVHGMELKVISQVDGNQTRVCQELVGRTVSVESKKCILIIKYRSDISEINEEYVIFSPKSIHDEKFLCQEIRNPIDGPIEDFCVSFHETGPGIPGVPFGWTHISSSLRGRF